MTQSIGDRMKDNYEDRYRFKLTRRTPVIMRLDGRCFHTVTRGCQKPFDPALAGALDDAANALLNEIMGAKLAYMQSDEISILITDFDKLTTEAWFDYNVQKMCSIAAGVATLAFWSAFGKEGQFDCRVFNVPEAEVCNYFIWRQKDWERNSLFMFARSFFSHNALFEKKQSDIHDMLHGIGENWSELPEKWKNGRLMFSKAPRSIYAPIFTKHRDIIEMCLEVSE